MREVEIYCDGACKGNPGVGGWGALIICEGVETEIYGGEIEATNNQMELMAAIKALEFLDKGSNVSIYTDSQYVFKGMTEWINGWLKKNWKDVKNVDLWKRLLQISILHKIDWNWVKAHSDNIGNNRADFLANEGVRMVRSEV